MSKIVYCKYHYSDCRKTMKTNEIVISPIGIRRTLRKYKPMSAIAEYVWNGFDSGASEVRINWQPNDLGGIDKISIDDNGSGIDYHELEDKFRPFYDTRKAADPASHRYGLSSIHGKNGYERLTFFCFSEKAMWTTVFGPESKRQQYAITVLEQSLQRYEASDPISSSRPTGTRVDFTGCHDVYADDFARELEHHLSLEFAWFLELASPIPRKIVVNDHPLSYDSLVDERDRCQKQIGELQFDIRYVQWSQKLHDEYSRYYFINSHSIQVYNQYTTLNQKGDGFYHSVYIRSSLFDSILPSASIANGVNTEQLPLDFDDKSDKDAFREMKDFLHEYLSRKRKPFLRTKAKSYTDGLRQKKVLPCLGENPWDQMRRDALLNVIEELYVLEPAIFASLSEKQTRTLVGLLHLIIDSEERDALFEILQQIVQMDSEQREELARLLRRTEMSSIVSTIRLIEDRFIAMNELKQMVIAPQFYADEVTHLQSFMERHYWMFGEQYHLVAAAEVGFERALRDYVYILRGEKKDISLDHPHKRKQMDIFAVRWLHNTDTIDNIVLELKHPSITLGEEHLAQVKRYMSTILDIPQFNAGNMHWEFYLVGKDYDKYIEREIENCKPNGERYLAYKINHYKVYVLKWSEVWTNIELRHKFLLDKLQLRREALLTDKNSANDILMSLPQNTAAAVPITTSLVSERETSL